MQEGLWGDAYPVPTEPYEPLVPTKYEDLVRPPAPLPSLEMLLGRPYTTYLIGVEGLPFVKIGHTKTDAKTRLLSLQCGQPLKLSLLETWFGDYESGLHAHFAAHRVRGEWFDLSSLGDPVKVVQEAVDQIDAASDA